MTFDGKKFRKLESAFMVKDIFTMHEVLSESKDEDSTLQGSLLYHLVKSEEHAWHEKLPFIKLLFETQASPSLYRAASSLCRKEEFKKKFGNELLYLGWIQSDYERNEVLNSLLQLKSQPHLRQNVFSARPLIRLLCAQKFADDILVRRFFRDLLLDGNTIFIRMFVHAGFPASKTTVDEMPFFIPEGIRPILFSPDSPDKKPFMIEDLDSRLSQDEDTPCHTFHWFAETIQDTELRLAIVDSLEKAPVSYSVLEETLKKNNGQELLAQIKDSIDVNHWDSVLGTPLMYAASQGADQCLEVLVENGADILARDFQKRQVLHHLFNNDANSQNEALLIKMAEFLIAHGADASAADMHEYTPLHIVVNRAYMVSILVAAGARVNVQNRALETPLAIAAKKHAPQTFQELLRFNADCNAEDSKHYTPFLHILNLDWSSMPEWESAAWIAIVRSLLPRAKLFRGYSESALHLMARRHAPRELFDLLLKTRIDINQAHEGYTPAMIAAQAGDLDTLKILQEAGADLAIVTEKGSIYDVVNENSACVDYLGCKEYCAESHKFNEFGKTDLMYALFDMLFLDDPEPIAALIRKGENVNAVSRMPDTHRWAPLTIAAYQGLSKCTDLLLKNKAAVNYSGLNGKTALHYAIDRQVLDREHKKDRHSTCLDTARCLLAHDADVFAKDDEGETPLHCAAKGADPAFINLLAEAKADFSAVNIKHQSALEISLVYPWVRQLNGMAVELLKYNPWRIDVIRALLALGANVNQPGENNHTPLFSLLGKINGPLASRSQGTTLVESIIPIISLLLEQGAEPLHTNGESILHYVIRREIPKDILQFLARHEKIDIDARDSEGYTPLMRSVKARDSVSAQILMEAGANLHTMAPDGESALSLASHPEPWEWFNTHVIHIACMERQDILCALYKNALPSKTGDKLFDAKSNFIMDREKAAEMLSAKQSFFVLNGRKLGVNLSGDHLITFDYDHANGDLMAFNAIQPLLPLPENVLGNQCGQYDP